MDLRLNLHLPIITPRLEFSPLSQSHPPTTITPRIDFTDLWMGNHSGSQAVSDVPSDNDSDADRDDFVATDLGSRSEVSDDEMQLDNNGKIPKPPGAPGRPNSGGYNIENELRAWGSDKISEVMKFVKSRGDEFLDTTQCYSKQDLSEIAKICSTTAIRFPVVDKYENHWPVRDILKLHLKYTSEIHRKQEQPSKVVKTKGKRCSK